MADDVPAVAEAAAPEPPAARRSLESSWAVSRSCLTLVRLDVRDGAGGAAPAGAGYWGSGAHAPNEHVRLEDLPRAVRFNCHLFGVLAGQ